MEDNHLLVWRQVRGETQQLHALVTHECTLNCRLDLIV